jgi:hypothetical protein
MLALLAGCAESPVSLEQSGPTDEFAALLAEVGAVEDGTEAARRAGMEAPNLHFLLHQALRKVANEEGVEAARAIALELRQELQEIRREALEAGTPAARREAAAAIELATAEVVVEILGTEVVDRVMTVAEQRIAALEARIEAAPDSVNTARAERLLTQMEEELAKAEAALETDPAQALIHALRAAQGWHRILPGPRPAARETA